MSSQSDDSIRIAATSTPSAAPADTQVSLDDGVLERYVLGILRPDEAEAATQFFSDPIRARTLRNFQIWAEHSTSTPPDRALMLKKLWGRICDHEQPGTPSFLMAAQRAGQDSTEKLQPGRMNPVLGTKTLLGRALLPSVSRIPILAWGTALVFLVVVVGMAGRKIHVLQATAPFATASRQYTTTVGQRAVVTLDDGSRVTLAPQSRLSVDRHFGPASRIIELSGQAFFDVTSAKNAPFVVRTGNVSTRVIGTQFSVRRYDLERAVQVSVVTGKVAVSNGTRQFVVTPGTIAQLTDSTVTSTSVESATAYTDWTHNRLVFERAPVPVVLEAVGRWYGYEFHLRDSTLTAQRITLVLDANDSRAMLLALKAVLEVTMAFDGTSVTLTPRPSNTRLQNIRRDPTNHSREIGR
jgi:transmembrane sensor